MTNNRSYPMQYWTLSDGFDTVHKIGSELEKMLVPGYRQACWFTPILKGVKSKEVGRRGCCNEQFEWTRDEFLERIAELPPEAEIHHTVSDGFGESWSFYLYRDLTDDEKAEVRAKLNAEAARRDERDHATFDQLSEAHPEWLFAALKGNKP